MTIADGGRYRREVELQASITLGLRQGKKPMVVRESFLMSQPCAWQLSSFSRATPLPVG